MEKGPSAEQVLANCPPPFGWVFSDAHSEHQLHLCVWCPAQPLATQIQSQCTLCSYCPGSPKPSWHPARPRGQQAPLHRQFTPPVRSYCLLSKHVQTHLVSPLCCPSARQLCLFPLDVSKNSIPIL